MPNVITMPLSADPKDYVREEGRRGGGGWEGWCRSRARGSSFLLCLAEETASWQP